jgi:hypothetical protein
MDLSNLLPTSDTITVILKHPVTDDVLMKDDDDNKNDIDDYDDNNNADD